ncbi:hypothetical protein D3C80_1690680 [compost metagenome]
MSTRIHDTHLYLYYSSVTLVLINSHFHLQLFHIHSHLKLLGRISEVDPLHRNDVMIVAAVTQLHISPVHHAVIRRIEADPSDSGNMRLHPCVRCLLEVGSR